MGQYSGNVGRAEKVKNNETPTRHKSQTSAMPCSPFIQDVAIRIQNENRGYC